MWKVWTDRLYRWHQKVQVFLIGRYAKFDQLNIFLLTLAFLFWLVTLLLPFTFINIFIVILTIYSGYRFLSKKIYLRLNENQRFVGLKMEVKLRFNNPRQQKKRDFQILNCPTCYQRLRVPKGKGKIKITCSKCRMNFIERV